MNRILAAIAREERKRETFVAKDKPARKHRPRKRIRWDRALPHETSR